LDDLRAHTLVVEDSERFDLAMALRLDRGAQVVRMVDYCELSKPNEVPDPCYDEEEGFIRSSIFLKMPVSTR
jgi:hypothetical protein